MAKALKMASVGPVMVTILSGQFPSEMLILAPLYRGSEQTPDAGAKPSQEWAGFSWQLRGLAGGPWWADPNIN